MFIKKFTENYLLKFVFTFIVYKYNGLIHYFLHRFILSHAELEIDASLFIPEAARLAAIILGLLFGLLLLLLLILLILRFCCG